MSVLRSDIFNFNYFNYGETFFGSDCGKRYSLARVKITDEADSSERKILRAFCWPEPLCFEATPEEKRQMKDFEFNEDGVVAAIEWINECNV